ncbi:MAG: TetR/AcrR family transcriptional regulator [Candidatus Lindowbacteria bacterium]|nr:TetR/AcrR family transcriptional regulator [Candidatus Lindowbacteria bacterium]
MTRRKVAEERRKEIIAGLYECLASTGYEEISIKDIAKAAKVSHGALHYYFKSKKDIVFAFVEEFVKEEEARFNGLVTSVDSAWGRLDALIAFLTEDMIFDKKANTVFFNLYHMGCHDDDIRRCLVGSYSHMRNLIRDTVEYGISRGEFPAVDSEKLAFILTGVVDGFSLQLSMDPNLCDKDTAKQRLYEIVVLLFANEERKQEIPRQVRG